MPQWEITTTVKERREILGWSVRELARRAGVAPSTVIGVEMGGNCTKKTVAAIDGALLAAESAALAAVEAARAEGSETP